MQTINIFKLYRCLEPNCLETIAFEFLDHDGDNQLVCQKHSGKYKRRGFTLTRTTPEMLNMYQNANYGFFDLRNAITKFRMHNSAKFRGFIWKKNKIIGNAAELLDDKDLELDDDVRDVLIKLRNIDVWINTLDMELEKLNNFLGEANVILDQDRK